MTVGTVFRPAQVSKPGDVLEYRVSYTNHWNAAVNGLVASLPITVGTTLVDKSQLPPDVEASTDGTRFAPLPLMHRVRQADGSEQQQPVPLSEYRALRWSLGTLATGMSEQVSARVRVNSKPSTCRLPGRQADRLRISSTASSFSAPAYALATDSRPQPSCVIRRPAARQHERRESIVIVRSVSTNIRPSHTDRLRNVVMWIAAALLCLAAINYVARAVPPPAGTSISNQASATYTDTSGVSHTVTSNAVQTTVTQVASLTLTANGAQNATAGTVVYYPETLTNTGNGSDTFRSDYRQHRWLHDEQRGHLRRQLQWSAHRLADHLERCAGLERHVQVHRGGDPAGDGDGGPDQYGHGDRHQHVRRHQDGQRH